MVLDAAADYDIDLTRSYFIGDKTYSAAAVSVRDDRRIRNLGNPGSFDRLPNGADGNLGCRRDLKETS